jgi:hypothetical protein
LQTGGLGNAFAGAVVTTLGMFLPCFIFTIAGHDLLEKLVRNKVSTLDPLISWQAADCFKFLAAFFDGLCGAVIGVIAIIAAQILQSSVAGSSSSTLAERALESGPAAVLYFLALGALYRFTNKYTTLLMVVCAAVAGQFIFLHPD